MNDFYNISVISTILKIFKVKDLIILGVIDKNLQEMINSVDLNVTTINMDKNNESIQDYPLNALPKLNNYDAIFINDDANWYTIFNELNIIKDTNKDFPLVFICNNKFPNKFRDSYINPDKIPKEFRHKYKDNFPICYNDEHIFINDGFYHAYDENTSRNGVSVAISDFLEENSHIGVMDINFIDEITVLYLKSPLNHKKIKIIVKHSDNEKIFVDISDRLIENQLLTSYINKFNLFDENLNNLEAEISKKDNLIITYEKQLKLNDNELDYKESQISGIKSKLDLKDVQIKNVESKLINKNRKINSLQNELSEINLKTQKLNEKESEYNKQIASLKNDLKNNETKLNNQFNKFSEKENEFKNKESEYNKQIASLKIDLKNNETKLNNQINSLKNDFNVKESQLNAQIKSNLEQLSENEYYINQKENQLDIKEKQLNSLQHIHNKQLAKLDTKEYCISCFKDEISNNHLEINYLNKKTLTKILLSPLSYLYLILKSNPREISINLKLYKALKNSECFDIGFYLNNNKDLIKSRWCKYFSPELHYVCKGFNENRIFNKKYFNRNSKSDLLNYLLTCEKSNLMED